jgi:hypothetical protein
MKKMVLAAAMALSLLGTAAWAAAQDFTIVNETGRTVVTLNISPTGENEWGPDLLGSEVMAEGTSASVTFDVDEARCLWDIRATFDDAAVGDWRALDLCEISTITLD